MSSGLQADLDRIPSQRFAAVADEARVTRTAAALEANGFSVLHATSAEEAKRIVLGLIPAGSQVHQGASQSLEVSGIVDSTQPFLEVGHEDARAQAAYGIHSAVNKVLITNREIVADRITVVLVG